MSTAEAEARAAATAAARDAYGRLLAWLAWQWRDIAAAEDALADAFATALARWPRDGVPDSPEGWLMTAAKRNLLKADRSRRRTEARALALPTPGAARTEAVPDARLRLLFVCAHPAIDPTIRSALMLQTVLGLDAARIAPAFLLSPEAMTKRLVRAKAKIKATGIRFEEPDAEELPARLDGVLDAIYGAYGVGRGDAREDVGRALAEEAVFLAELVAARLPGEPEALGLLALLLLCEARRPARLDADGAFVPLDRQDPARWDAGRIARGNGLLAAAAALGEVGPFQVEAAIQAAHCDRLRTGRTPWADIARLYERLLALHDGVGARIGHAIAAAHAEDRPAVGLRLLDAIHTPAVRGHAPWWAARAHLLAALPGREAEAFEAFDVAISLTDEEAPRLHLARRRDALGSRVH